MSASSEIRFEWAELRQRQQDPTWRFSQGHIEHVHGWLVSTTTAQGLTGYGYVLTTPIGKPNPPRTYEALKAGAMALRGITLFETERMHRTLYEACSGVAPVRAGIVGAVYDLMAKQHGVSLHQILGGAITRTALAARLLPIKEPEEMAQAARELTAEGYRILKIKLSGEWELDTQRVQAVRQAAGPTALLTVDANQAYETDAAVELCKVLSGFGVSLVEQPVAGTDWEGMARITRESSIAIEADESIAGSLQNLLKLIEMKAAHSFNLKVPYFGGLRDTLLAAQLCQTAGMQCRVGAIFGPRLASAQAAHLASILPAPTLGVELAESEHILDDPFSGFDVKNGSITVSDAIGTGVDFNSSNPEQLSITWETTT
ncbi:mandelate racemase/muconate lactonizing enzyme family protein [Ottowia thiooxydans]|uniref:mandelate racemase/muconate lactonizing enzyme family protein n=1 Tax=Ottowia thiooxydans TaxID=219182 RepID=UPI00040E0060|nr:enolase C-terminal domain-like protein [Ottowia thiooxydans]